MSDPKMLESIGLAEKEEESPSLVVGRAVALTTGVEYIPELDAVLDMRKFQAQLEIPKLERAVIEAAVAAYNAEQKYSTRDDYSVAEMESAFAVQRSAVSALLKARDGTPNV